MLEATPERRGGDPGTRPTLPLHSAGSPGAGQYRCATCGYGITVRAPLPVCPMCASRSWEAVPWTPFTGRAGVRRLRRPPAAH